MYNYDSTVSQNQRQFYTSSGTKLGKDISGRDVRIPEGALDGHLLVIGKTGTGKSNLLAKIISEAARSEEGNIVLLDPHGTLADRVISHGVPREFVNLVPGVADNNGEKRAITFNPIFVGSGEDQRIEKITGWLRDIFAGDDALSAGYWGPRLEVIFRVVLPEMLRQHPDLNLLEFADIISDKNSMRAFLDRIGDESVRNFISGQSRDWKGWVEYISSTMNRILPLLSSDATRHFISGAQDSVDLTAKLSGENSFLSLDASGERYSRGTVRILASLILMRIWLSVMESFYSLGKRIRTTVVIDEFQNIPQSIVESLLSEGRKFGIRLVLATQYLPHLKRETTASILGNVRNFVCFNISDEDALEMSRIVPAKSERKEFLEAVKAQRLHSAVLVSQLGDGVAGPLTLYPEWNGVHVDYRILEELKKRSFARHSAVIGAHDTKDADASVTAGSENIEEKPQTRGTWKDGIHERILGEFESFLLKNGITMERPARLGGKYPDGIFHHKGKKHIVEVEVSDVQNPVTILEKLATYSGMYVIFIAQDRDPKLIHDYILDRIKYRMNDSLAVEIPTVVGGKRVYAREFAGGLPGVLLLSRGKNGFKCYWDGKYRRLLLRHLDGPFTFQRELNSGRFGEIKNYTYRLMLEAQRFALRKSEILGIQVMNKGYLVDFVNRFGKWDNGFITLADLFKV